MEQSSRKKPKTRFQMNYINIFSLSLALWILIVYVVESLFR